MSGKPRTSISWTTTKPVPVVATARPAMMRKLLNWFFRNRETGAITIVQAPNLVLWIVIAAALLRWLWPPSGQASVVLTVIIKGGLLLWAADEIVRGVNPWRRCLGTAVAIYEITTVLPHA
ncbi:hypothetical protein ACFPGQ_05140 [Bradyrhizobium sp. GCM10023181]